jgi:F-type H+-transporting ATPase subunit delta
MLANNRQGRETRYRLLERVLDISPMALNFAKLLVNKGRTLEADHIAGEFRRLADLHMGISNATVTTAVELTPQESALIQQRLEASTGKSVRLATQVDPTIIGGLVVRVDDELIDGSVRSRLHQLRRHLEGVA